MKLEKAFRLAKDGAKLVHHFKFEKPAHSPVIIYDGSGLVYSHGRKLVSLCEELLFGDYWEVFEAYEEFQSYDIALKYLKERRVVQRYVQFPSGWESIYLADSGMIGFCDNGEYLNFIDGARFRVKKC